MIVALIVAYRLVVDTSSSFTDASSFKTEDYSSLIGAYGINSR